GHIGARSCRRRSHYGALHDDQWPDAQCQSLALDRIKGGILMTGSATETWLVGVTERRVVGDARRFQAVQSGRGFPTQIVHAGAHLLQRNACLRARPAQTVGFGTQGGRITIGVVAGVQSDLVPTCMDALHEVDDGGVLGEVMPVAAFVRVPAYEIEGVTHTGFFCAIHDPVEAVERVLWIQLAFSASPDPWEPTYSRAVPFAGTEQIDPHRPEQAPGAEQSVAGRRIDIVRK